MPEDQFDENTKRFQDEQNAIDYFLSLKQMYEQQRQEWEPCPSFL